MNINDIAGLYKGHSAFLICDGPSFKDVDKEKLNTYGVITMGVNNSPKSFRPNMWCCVDGRGSFIESIYKDPRILKFIPYPTAKHSEPPTIGYSVNREFDPEKFINEDTVCYKIENEFGSCRSIFPIALKILIKLGFTKIFLLGVDFTMDENSENYHFDQKTSKHCVNTNNKAYRILDKMLRDLKPFLSESGIEVFNCNKDSKLTAFNYKHIDDCVKMAKEDIPDPDNESTDGLYDIGWQRAKERRVKNKIVGH